MMGQRQREQVQRGCAVGTVVLLAWLCRVLPLEGLPSGLQEACGILRSLLYLSLFAGWGISLYNRTVHPQVRRLLLNVDLLMLFWILVRTLRFQLNTPPGMDRMLGYLYYAPMLGIPVLCVQLVLTVDRSERYRLSAWARMLWLPSAVLLELVLTNDLHQQVFRLQQPWNENYQYGWLFGLVVGWIVICILLAFGIIAHKSRNPRILRRLPLPAIPMVLLGVYAVLYGFHFPLIRQFLGDMTIVHCLMTAASLEGGLRCGLIQSNTGYEELLRQNQELLRMNRELRRLSENVQEMTREKEILEFKTRLHDKMGYGLTAVRQCLLQRKDPAELEASLEQMNKAVQLFRKDSETPPEENEWDVFVEDAAQLGVTVALQGPMPRQHQQLLLTIARECITNAVRYAGANRLEITITPQGGGQRWQFENDGPPPADPAITPGGGLTAIQRRVMQAGGTMEVQARPRYRLCVNLPKEETI